MAIAFATCRQYPQLTADDRIAANALARRGFDVIPAIWDDDAVAWDSFELVVLRSMWDYHLAPAAFYEWLDRLERSSVSVLNPLPIARWNVNKLYLRDLHTHGLPIVPSAFVDRGEDVDLAAILAERAWSEIVLKPVISSTAYNTARFRAEQIDEARVWLNRILATTGAIVQEYRPEIIGEGEWSLIYIDGDFSHAVLKRGAPGDFRIQPEYGGTAERVEPPAQMRATAGRFMGSIQGDWLYGRVDGVDTPDGFRLMEFELLEPHLLFENAPESATRFADAIVRRVTTHAR